MDYFFRRTLVLVIVGVLFLSWANLFGQSTGEIERKVGTAIRVGTAPPKIDGHLDDPVWQNAPIMSDFRQDRPNRGELATEKTEIQIVYDDNFLYVAARLYDSEPDKIVGRLGRRDVWSESDWVVINIDSRHDRQTCYGFSVNPVGVQRDYFLYNDNQALPNWSGVWESETQIDEQSWTAEMKIPFSMFRFSQEKEQTWGFNPKRTMARNNEISCWCYTPEGESGIVSLFGDLTGFSDLKSPRRLEILPYIVSKAEVIPGDDEFHFDAGSDFKYGLSSNFTLDGTINPDFGQVEADPSVLNLTAFETFFSEQRPFFIEGGDIFTTNLKLFHSRRIGKSPGWFKTEPGDTITDKPKGTTIIGAVKLTGKTSNGLSVALLNAVTAKEYATITDTSGNEHERLIEPITNYFVGRLEKEFSKERSTVGLLATAVNRDGSKSAYAGGLDWDLKFKRNMYNFNGQIVSSQTELREEDKTGYGLDAKLSKKSGKWFRADLHYEMQSPELQLNDIGFLSRNDWIGTDFLLQFRTEEPMGIIRESSNNFKGFFGWNYDDYNLLKRMEFSNSIKFMNYWETGITFKHNFEVTDDSDTFRGGTLIKSPASNYGEFWFLSDNRKVIYINPKIWFESDDNDGKENGYELKITLNPATNLLFELSSRYTKEKETIQWVENKTTVTTNGILIDYIYGQLDSEVFDFTLKSTMTFTRDLTLQLYLQPFIAVGEYSDLKKLVKPNSLDFEPYSYNQNLDFNRKNLNSNVVLRWEYRPSSRVYFVWSQSRSDSNNHGQFRLGKDLNDLFSAEGEHIFLIKVDYWLNL